MKYFEHIESDMPNTDEWNKDDIRIMINSAITCLCPIEECENYFERTDMMTTSIFYYTLIGIVLGIDQWRKIVRENIDRDEAIWLLGWYGIMPTETNSDALWYEIEKEKQK